VSISATETATTGLFATGGSASTTGTANAADKEMFLQLLVAQMRYQDPMNPTDSSQFLAQSAQFTSLEKMQDVADQTAQLLSAQVAFGASGLVGREVTYTGADGATLSGSVSGVSFGAEGPVLDIGGTSVPLSLVQSVTTGSTGSSSTSSSTSTTTSEPTA
jgi:flagellar basal-body rod modification protein FlgD